MSALKAVLDVYLNSELQDRKGRIVEDLEHDLHVESSYSDKNVEESILLFHL